MYLHKLHAQFGGKATSEHKARYAQSPNWKDGKFQNLTQTGVDLSFQELPSMLHDQFSERKLRHPKAPLPIAPFDADTWATDATKFAWYGHSVVLLKINGLNVLIDPMLGPNASPIAPFKTKRFSEGSLEAIDAMPELDLVLLTHDHYDHLDYDSIMRLKGKTKHFYTALGVGRHLENWGIPASNITEFDWWDEAELGGIQIVFTPSRHFSGRGLRDRALSLWGGWVFITEQERIYFTGDGGYGDHFAAVAEKFGPFDFGFVECGQYSKYWSEIHMMPEESAQAAADGQIKVAVPVHWGGFSLSLHPWQEPVERFMAGAEKQAYDTCTPTIGSIVVPSVSYASEAWWEGIE